MKKFAPKLTLIGVLAVLSFSFFAPIKSALAAGSATLSLTPASGSYEIGSTLSVTIHENSGANQTNAVQADLTYETSKLQFLGIDTGSSAFDLSGPSNGGSGAVSINRGKSGSNLTGDQVVASVNFKVLAGSGTTTINFANTSVLVEVPTLTNMTLTKNGGTYTLTTPPAPDTGGGGTTTPTPSTPSSTTPSTTKPSTSSSAPSTNQSNSSSQTPQSSTTMPTTPTETPLTNASTGTGQYVAIRVVDANNKPVEGAKVTIKDQTKTTDKTGVAGFDNIAPGEYQVEIESNGKKITQSIGVVAGVSTQVQEYNAQLPVNKKINILPVIIVLIAILLVAAGVILWLLNKRRFRKQPIFIPPTPNTPTSSTPPAASAINIPPSITSPSHQPGQVIDPAHNNKIEPSL